MSAFRSIVFTLFIFQLAFNWGQNVIPIFQTGHYSKVNKVAFHPNNQNLISSGDDGKMIVWDINLGLQRAEVLAHQNGILDFDFLNDKAIVTLGHNNSIKTWSFPNLELIDSYVIEQDSIQALVVLRTDELCIAGRYVHFYDMNSRKLQTTTHKSKWLFTSIDYHKSRHEVVVTGPKDNYAVAIDLKDPLFFKKYYLGNIHVAKYADSLILLAATNGWLQYHNIESKKRNIHSLADDLNYISDMDGHKNQVALGTAFGFTTILNSKEHNIITSIGLSGAAISAVAYSNNGQWLATSNTQGIIYLYDTEQYRINKILKGASANITDLKVFSTEMVVGYSDGIIRHIDLPNNRIKSNSIKLDLTQEQSGVNYAIQSIDTIRDGTVYFTVLKTDRHHIKTSVLTSAKTMNAVWELKSNEISLSQNLFSFKYSKLVRYNFKQNLPFQLSDYTASPNKYIFNQVQYEIDTAQYRFFKLQNGNRTDFITKHDAPIRGLQYLPAYQIILSYSDDASIRFWKTTGEYLAVLYLSGQYSFFYQSSNNFYFASKEILSKIGFIYNEKLFSYEQYDVYYNRPAEVMEKLLFFKADDVTDYQKAYFKRLQKLGVLVNELEVSDILPEIAVDYFDEYSTKKEVVSFSLEMADLSGNVTGYSYLINGIEKQFVLKEPQPRAIAEVDIVLGTGINQVEFYCVNDKGIKSMLKKKVITCEKSFGKPNLYLVTIGMSMYNDKKFDLKYAEKDANEINFLMQKNKRYNKVKSLNILNNRFTKTALEEFRTFLSEAKINDVIVLYYAGHGVLDNKFNYYLATYNMDFNNPTEKGLSFDDLENLFEGLACRNKLMMIDACFSGEIDKTSLVSDSSKVEKLDSIQFRSTQLAAIDGNGDMGIFELSKRIFTDLRVSKGTNILSSSSGIEYALEGDKWGNGLFTYALKKGLVDGEADLNDDNQIRIMELQVYLLETVSELSKGIQNPILRKENIKNNFVIW